MWIANDWKEYEVIDASCGEKLERWGQIHPGPSGSAGYLGYPKGKPWLENMNAHYHRSKKEAVNGSF